jgi:hypothetical protein
MNERGGEMRAPAAPEQEAMKCIKSEIARIAPLSDCHAAIFRFIKITENIGTPHV